MFKKVLCLDDKAFYNQIWLIAIPIGLQNLINFGVAMMDTLMVGKLGVSHLSAASAANQMTFMFMILSFGIANGCSVLAAQYWGSGNPKKIGNIIAFMYRVVVIVSIIFTIIGVMFPEFVLKLFIPDETVIAVGVPYLRIISIGFIFTGITNSTIGILRSIGTVKISIVVYSVSLIVNTILNYCLIFGKFGFPELGISGAAIATLIAKIIESIIVMVYLFRYEKKLNLKISDLKTLEKEVVSRSIQFSLPVLINELLWSVGAMVIASIIGHIGTEALAANSICSVLFQFAQALIFGFSSAAASIIGNTIGSGEYDVAKRRANAFAIIGVILGIFSCGLMSVARFPLISFYESSLTAKTIELAYSMSFVASFMVIFQSVSMLTMMGVLRGGGDTKFVMVADVIFMWVISIPVGALAGLVLGFPVHITYMILKSEDIWKASLACFRIFRGNWLRDITR